MFQLNFLFSEIEQKWFIRFNFILDFGDLHLDFPIFQFFIRFDFVDLFLKLNDLLLGLSGCHIVHFQARASELNHFFLTNVIETDRKDIGIISLNNSDSKNFGENFIISLNAFVLSELWALMTKVKELIGSCY